jgi:hypothetical protein
MSPGIAGCRSIGSLERMPTWKTKGGPRTWGRLLVSSRCRVHPGTPRYRLGPALQWKALSHDGGSYSRLRASFHGVMA